MIPWWFLYNPHIGVKGKDKKLKGTDVLGLTFISFVILFVISVVYFTVFYGRVG